MIARIHDGIGVLWVHFQAGLLGRRWICFNRHRENARKLPIDVCYLPYMLF